MVPHPTVLHKIAVAARRIARVASERFAGSLPPGKYPELGDDEFRDSIEAALRPGDGGAIARRHFLFMPGNAAPWRDTGIDISPGDNFTWVAGGRVYLSKALDIFVEPHFQLWARIGTGPIFSGSRATHTFAAEKGGRLYLASYFPGEWADEGGRLKASTPESRYKGIKGGISVALIRWNTDPLEGLKQIAKRGPGHPLLDLEIDRLGAPASPPAGWKELWYLGKSEIYSEAGPEGTHREIHCRTRCDVSILRHELDAPFEPGTRMAWSWRVDALPSAFAEDILLTHDYLSIAVEFDNGIDLTYYWSKELPEGTGYWCPLPTWKDREYHIVARSGSAQLGRWLDEDRDLYGDYERHIGAPPARIRHVWLIANSLFQRIEGRAAYRDIRVLGAGGTCHPVGR